MYQQLIFKLLLKNVAISGHSNEKKKKSRFTPMETEQVFI